MFLFLVQMATLVLLLFGLLFLASASWNSRQTYRVLRGFPIEPTPWYEKLAARIFNLVDVIRKRE